MESAVPIVDLAPARLGLGERRRVARAIDVACREIGFFAVSGHGVPPALIDDARRVAHAFFERPAAEKLAARHPVPGTNRGYHPAGGETLAAANDGAAPPDLKEYFHVGPVDVGDDDYYTSPLGRRHFAPNLWPVAPPGFERALTAYYRAMSGLVTALMRLAASGLDVEETFFDDKVDRSIGTMRLNYYPAQSAAPRPGQLRASAHTDYGGFTILSGEDVPGGLQVRTRAGDWIDVHTSPATFVVNIGDLLMRWTNDRWLSNLHRVANPPGGAGRARLSIAFFSHPNYDVWIECLPSGGLPRHPPVLSGAYRDEKYAKTGLAGGEDHESSNSKRPTSARNQALRKDSAFS